MFKRLLIYTVMVVMSGNLIYAYEGHEELGPIGSGSSGGSTGIVEVPKSTDSERGENDSNQGTDDRSTNEELNSNANNPNPNTQHGGSSNNENSSNNGGTTNNGDNSNNGGNSNNGDNSNNGGSSSNNGGYSNSGNGSLNFDITREGNRVPGNNGYILDTMLNPNVPIREDNTDFNYSDFLNEADQEKSNSFKMTLGEVQEVDSELVVRTVGVERLQKNLYDNIDTNVQDVNRNKINSNTLVDEDSDMSKITPMYFVSKRDFEIPWYMPVLIGIPIILFLSFLTTSKEYYKERVSEYIDEMN